MRRVIYLTSEEYGTGKLWGPLTFGLSHEDVRIDYYAAVWGTGPSGLPVDVLPVLHGKDNDGAAFGIDSVDCPPVSYPERPPALEAPLQRLSLVGVLGKAPQLGRLFW
jgi:hypothetical protein